MNNPTIPTLHPHSRSALERGAPLVLRYGLALVFLLFGLFKFTAYEAKGIAPFEMHSPLLSWAFNLLGERGLANAIGSIELAIGVLIALRPVSARMASIGGLGACITYLITLSFLFSTPGALQEGYGFPYLSGMIGQFLIKDLVLLGASMWVAAEALHAARGDMHDTRAFDVTTTRDATTRETPR